MTSTEDTFQTNCTAYHSTPTARETAQPPTRRHTSLLLRGLTALTLALLLIGGPAFGVFAQTDGEEPDTPTETVTPETNEETDEETDAQEVVDEPGVLIVAVQANSPAAQAGLVRGDILLTIDDLELNDAAALITAIGEAEAGATVEITWLHGAETQTASVDLAEQNGVAFLGVQPYLEQGRASIIRAHLGNQLEQLDPEDSWGLRRMLLLGETPGAEAGELRLRMHMDEHMGEHMMLFHGMPDDIEGVVILGVLPDSSAAEAGLTPGTIITSLDGEPVDDPQTIQDAIQALAPGDSITLEIYTPIPVSTEAASTDAETEDAETDWTDQLESITITLGAAEDDDETAFLGVYGLPVSQVRAGHWFMHGDMAMPGMYHEDMHHGYMHREGMHAEEGLRMRGFGLSFGMMMPRKVLGDRSSQEGTMGRFGGWGEREFGASRWAHIPFVGMIHAWIMDRWGTDWDMMPMFHFFEGPRLSPSIEAVPSLIEEPDTEAQPGTEAQDEGLNEATPRTGDFF